VKRNLLKNIQKNLSTVFEKKLKKTEIFFIN